MNEWTAKHYTAYAEASATNGVTLRRYCQRHDLSRAQFNKTEFKLYDHNQIAIDKWLAVGKCQHSSVYKTFDAIKCRCCYSDDVAAAKQRELERKML